MHFWTSAFFACFLVLSLASQAQFKHEAEYRISDAEVPRQAIGLIEELLPDGHVKWYREESQDGITLEAKSKRERLSIEFDTLGHIQDIEKEVKWKTLPQDIREDLDSTLCQTFQGYRIQKVQRQWRPAKGKIIELYRSGSEEGRAISGYEIVLVGRLDGERKEQFEVFITPDFRMKEKLRIIDPPIRNMMY